MTPRAGQTLGLEMEMVVARRESGTSHPVVGYFDALAAIKTARGEAPDLVRIDGKTVGVSVAAGESGLDNGFNLLETALAPVSEEEGGWPNWRGVWDANWRMRAPPCTARMR